MQIRGVDVLFHAHVLETSLCGSTVMLRVLTTNSGASVFYPESGDAVSPVLANVGDPQRFSQTFVAFVYFVNKTRLVDIWAVSGIGKVCVLTIRLSSGTSKIIVPPLSQLKAVAVIHQFGEIGLRRCALNSSCLNSFSVRYCLNLSMSPVVSVLLP